MIAILGSTPLQYALSNGSASPCLIINLVEFSKIVIWLKQFATSVIETKKLALPVKVELMDFGLNPIYEIEVTDKDAAGTWQFSKERQIAGTLSHPKPYSVRFTTPDNRHFVIDIPDPD